MEGLLHYTSNWWWVLVVIGLVWSTDLIDWIVDKWEEK
jgi:CDP-diglyceride synthetase|tara:strand:- start:425 stop:538 length:114 start_codon:yes stop_codon:yes gene_type:complete